MHVHSKHNKNPFEQLQLLRRAAVVAMALVSVHFRTIWHQAGHNCLDFLCKVRAIESVEADFLVEVVDADPFGLLDSRSDSTFSRVWTSLNKSSNWFSRCTSDAQNSKTLKFYKYTVVYMVNKKNSLSDDRLSAKVVLAICLHIEWNLKSVTHSLVSCSKYSNQHSIICGMLNHYLPLLLSIYIRPYRLLFGEAIMMPWALPIDSKSPTPT